MARTLILATAFILMISDSVAHTVHDHGTGLSMTYDAYCCGGNDCAPANRVEYPGHGEMIVTSPHGKVTVPASMPRRPSQDTRIHVCIVGGQARCIYVPPGL